MKILGISAYYHDSAACLLRDGEIVAAAHEERFTRKKHDDACMSLGIALLTMEKDQEKEAPPEETVRRRSAAVYSGLDEELMDGEDVRIEDEVWL